MGTYLTQINLTKKFYLFNRLIPGVPTWEHAILTQINLTKKI